LADQLKPQLSNQSDVDDSIKKNEDEIDNIDNFDRFGHFSNC